MSHPKSVLIERCQALALPKPIFSTNNTGPDHDPTFICDVIINDEVYGTGQATKKSDAERNASEEALLSLEEKKPAKQSRQKKASKGNNRNSTKSKSAPKKEVNEEHSDEEFEGQFEGQFEGPWPMFADVLASCINTANERTDKKLTGDNAIAEVNRLSLKLYKFILEDLSEVEEIEDDDY